MAQEQTDWFDDLSNTTRSNTFIWSDIKTKKGCRLFLPCDDISIDLICLWKLATKQNLSKKKKKDKTSVCIFSSMVLLQMSFWSDMSTQPWHSTVVKTDYQFPQFTNLKNKAGIILCFLFLSDPIKKTETNDLLACGSQSQTYWSLLKM